MITKLKIENFRSIEYAELNLGKINVLTGSNNSGKTSFLYAILALRNIFQNPNRGYDSLFNFENVINLGGLKDVTYLKNTQRSILFGVEIDNGEHIFSLLLNESNSVREQILKSEIKAHLISNISFPYTNTSNRLELNFRDKVVPILWHGFAGVIEEMIMNPVKTSTKDDLIVNTEINKVFNNIMQVDIISISQRTFTKQTYNAIPLQQNITTEDELATSLALDRDLVGAISHYSEKILNRVFTVHNIIGAGFFYLQTRNRETGFISDLVNEGTGTSQVITILAKALQKNKTFICIDEPEIHLHPSIITKLVDALIEIANNENKQFLISTHNEHFMSCLLRAVSEEKLNSEDLKVYYLTKEDKKTEVEYQPVNEYGQIEGGMKNFYEAELENLSKLFNLANKE